MGESQWKRTPVVVIWWPTVTLKMVDRAQGDFDATIPEHHVFVLGDNRDRAKDSRHFGTIHLADIVGYVEYIYWPSESWSRFGVANDRLP